MRWQSYSFNYKKGIAVKNKNIFTSIPPLIFKNAHEKSVKHTVKGSVSFDHWMYLFVAGVHQR